MPGGVGAGTPLGLFCFLVLFNKAGPPESKTTIGHQITAPRKSRKPMDKGKVKWVDDMTVQVSLHLPTALVPDTRRTSHGRCHIGVGTACDCPVKATSCKMNLIISKDILISTL